MSSGDRYVSLTHFDPWLESLVKEISTGDHYVSHSHFNPWLFCVEKERLTGDRYVNKLSSAKD